MSMVTFALASLLSTLAMLWVATTNWRRFVDTGEVGTAPVEAVGLGMTLLYALGAACAFGTPPVAAALLMAAGLLGIATGLLGEVTDLIVLGASAMVPAATSIIRSRSA
jgi:hypothetical protein